MYERQLTPKSAELIADMQYLFYVTVICGLRVRKAGRQATGKAHRCPNRYAIGDVHYLLRIMRLSESA